MPKPIPKIYRILFTTIEPILATTGAAQTLLSPSFLMRSTLPSVPYSTALAPLLTQMTGLWLMLAFHDLTLRSSDDVRVWRHTLAASAVSDLFCTASLVQSMGLAWFLDPLRWGAGTAVAVVFTVAPFLGKLCFLAGVGLPGTGVAGRKSREEKTV